MVIAVSSAEGGGQRLPRPAVSGVLNCMAYRIAGRVPAQTHQLIAVGGVKDEAGYNIYLGGIGSGVEYMRVGA